MSNDKMKLLCNTYIVRAKIIGFLYFSVPLILIYAWYFVTLPFREVYVTRFVLSLVAGGIIAAYIHNFGIQLWMSKHRSKDGPATVTDGIFIGGAVGFYIALVPTLFILIQTNHLEEAKWIIIVSYISIAAIGAILGGIVAVIGKKYLD